MNLKQAAEYLGIAYITAQKGWPSWLKHGVVPARFPQRTLRFKREDLDKMMDLLKVA
jgi:predicted site-specific integrase-resolvase